MSTTKCKIEFSKVLQSLYMAKNNNNKKIGKLLYTFNRNVCFNSYLKLIFNLFWLKLWYQKNTLHALKLLITGGNERSHILKNKLAPFSCRFV